MVYRLIRCLLMSCLVMLLVAGCSGRQLVDTPILYIGVPDNPFADVPTSGQTPHISLIFGTDRTVSEQVSGEGDSAEYGVGRARSLAVGT